jgi:hypothetical protein
MNSVDIYVKTNAGTHELKSRARQLPQRLRTMLIMIDGSRSVAQLPEPALPVQPPSPAPMPALSDGERFNTAKQFMNDTIVDNLGLRAFFFTLKLEKCFTLADLEAMLPDYSKAIAKSRGSDVARKLEAQARSKLR